MIPELGHYALILALCLSLFQIILSVQGVRSKVSVYLHAARYAAIGQCFFVAFSFATLAFSFLTNDFSVTYVAEHSHTLLPSIYRFCAVWGGHEGSLLLWVFILTLWMLAVNFGSRHLPLEFSTSVLSVLAMIAVGFYLFLLLTSDPFQRLLPNFPINGIDLNPILQDPGLVSHPPMLYMGYVGFSVAFAFSVVALWRGHMDNSWVRWARPWTRVAWCFLTLGIVLGSWWSYRQLGWGGWWFWDPVENASLMPWLAGTALLHSFAVSEKRQAFQAWTLLLAITAFSLSLLGTFLVRSGVLISVHAFASDPKRGLWMLCFLAIVVGSSLTLYAWRSRQLVTKISFSLLSRESVLLANNILLLTAMLTILLGTLYPLMMDALHLGKLSVGAPYFNMIFIPLMLPLLFLLGIGPQFQWKKTNLAPLSKPSIYLLLLLVGFSALVCYLNPTEWKIITILGLSLGCWVVINTLFNFIRDFRGRGRGRGWSWRQIYRRQWGMLLAHLGVGVTSLGILLSSVYSQQRDVSMRPGEVASVGPYLFLFQGVKPLFGPNFHGAIGTVLAYKGGHYLSELHPEQRIFPVQNISTSRTAINASVFRDLYVALGAPLNQDAWAIRLYYKPFVRWIWAGGLLMALGGILTIFTRYFYRSSG